jgi:hypothetical protein
MGERADKGQAGIQRGLDALAPGAVVTVRRLAGGEHPSAPVYRIEAVWPGLLWCQCYHSVDHDIDAAEVVDAMLTAITEREQP